MGEVPDAEKLAQIEGVEMSEADEEQEEKPCKAPPVYLSDTGAEVSKATRELDEFVWSKRGRHGK